MRVGEGEELWRERQRLLSGMALTATLAQSRRGQTKSQEGSGVQREEGEQTAAALDRTRPKRQG